MPVSGTQPGRPPAGLGPVRLHAVVRGQVQGVGFRYLVRHEALRLGLTGWVANRNDGSVECEAQGQRGALEELVEVLAAGPPGASVDDLEVDWTPVAAGFEGFAIRSGSHPGD